MTDFTPNQKTLGTIFFSRSGEVLSGSFLSESLGISRQAVSKNIGILRKTGFPVFPIERKGYVLKDSEESLHPLLLENEIQRLGSSGKAWYFHSLSSTQKVMKEFAKKGIPEGSLVVGETQTAGKGRTARSWVSPAGKGLYFSLLLRPSLPPGCVQLLNLLAGLAVCQSIEECTTLFCDLKWPNDVLYGNKKICGILSEAATDSDSIRYAVVGIGINVNTTITEFPEEIRETATSLYDISKKTFSRRRLLLKIYDNFMRKYHLMLSRGFDSFLPSYEERCSTIGKNISLSYRDELLYGKAEGITKEGALILYTREERLILHSGDVRHLR